MAQPWLIARDRRVARRTARAAVRIRQREPIDASQHARDVGVAGHRHPRLAPDQVEHRLRGPPRRLRQFELALEFVAQRRGALAHAGQRTEGIEQLLQQREVVLRRAGMRDDQLGHEVTQRVEGFAPVLVDVEQHVGGPQAAQLREVHVLRAADLGHLAQLLDRVDAEAGARNQLLAQAQCDDQLGEAGHEAGDADAHSSPTASSLSARYTAQAPRK